MHTESKCHPVIRTKNRNPATSLPQIIQQFSKLEEYIFIKGEKKSKYFPTPKEASSVIPPEAFETRLGGPDSSSASSFPFWSGRCVPAQMRCLLVRCRPTQHSCMSVDAVVNAAFGRHLITYYSALY